MHRPERADCSESCCTPMTFGHIESFDVSHDLTGHARDRFPLKTVTYNTIGRWRRRAIRRSPSHPRSVQPVRSTFRRPTTPGPADPRPRSPPPQSWTGGIVSLGKRRTGSASSTHSAVSGTPHSITTNASTTTPHRSFRSWRSGHALGECRRRQALPGQVRCRRPMHERAYDRFVELFVRGHHQNWSTRLIEQPLHRADALLLSGVGHSELGDSYRVVVRGR
ncbi:hypothetical protein ATK86_1004 [Nocardia fluminea]|uniref:Uncharacterized protein n=1 Tax=Nocardia fluminea TaxID=134984 RepID=A0A2N3WYM9_9NOCA|nr:hypothetical protein ATK86_1004 [Nocardia fluminea]